MNDPNCSSEGESGGSWRRRLCRSTRRILRAACGRSCPLPHRGRSAFTLIELLVVMGIITVVVGVGIPVFSKLTGSNSVEAGRNTVAAIIGAARSTAVNEGKYAGVLFYIDPATERTAMSVVIVNVGGSQPAASGLEDSDPYEKYKAWLPNQDYYTSNSTGDTPRRADRVIGLAVDADATFKSTVYTGGNNNYANYFGNYRPVVRTYRCTKDNESDVNATRPPRNGPYGPYRGGGSLPSHYKTLPSQSISGAPTADSKEGPFGNTWWDAQLDKTITTDPSLSTGEQVLLPKGVAAQVIVEPISTNAAGAAPYERYLRTALVMFDPQGRLVQQSFKLSNEDQLGKYIGLTGVANAIHSGMGVVLFNHEAFKDAGFTEYDYIYQSHGWNAEALTANASMADGRFLIDPKTPPATFNGGESAEETWLDNNTTPLLINRYSGSMSETD